MKNPLICLFSFLFLIVGCNKNNMEEDLSGTLPNSTKEENSDGSWKDVIGLSTKTVKFTGKKDTVQINTENLGWWLESIIVDERKYEITSENKMAEVETHQFSQKCDWLTIDRKDKIITLIAASNNTGKERTFKLSLQSGDYFDSITGTQEVRLVGDWDDCIGLSQNKVEFDWQGGTVIINTEYNHWWFNTVEVDGIKTNIGKEGGAQIEEEGEFLKTFNWLTVHATYKKIELTVAPNYDKTRSFKISLQAGDYFTNIEGTQKEMTAVGGDWIDCIGLSKRKIEFSSEEGIITVDTKELGWWFNTIEVNDIKTNIGLEDIERIVKGEEFLKKCDWLTVNSTQKKIRFIVEPNLSGKERFFKLYLQAGDYFDRIEGIQAK